MSGWHALLAMVDLLKGLPQGLVPAGNVGLRRPAAPGDLPRIVVAASRIEESLSGVGGLIRSFRTSEGSWTSEGGTRASGEFDIELWVEQETEAVDIAAAVFEVMGGPPTIPADAGFLELAARSVGPIDSAPLATGDGSALRLTIGCAFVFEAVSAEETGPDGIIRRIHVEMDDELGEVMDLT